MTRRPTILATAIIAILVEVPMARATIYYVKADATGADDGTNWLNAFADFQAGIAAANNTGDEIWIASGAYSPGPSTSDFYLLNNTRIWRGGFEGLSGTEGDLSVQNPNLFVTTLNGFYQNDYVVRGAGISETTTLIDGLTITGGVSSGIRLTSSVPTLTRLKIDHNGLGLGRGGGLRVEFARGPVVAACEITNNVAAVGGTVPTPVAVTTGRFIGVSAPFLACADSANKRIVIFTDSGTGYSESDSIAVSNAQQALPVSIVAADLEADGDDDLIIGFDAGNTVSVLTCVGTRFSAMTLPSGRAPRFVTAGDVDGNGLPDILEVGGNDEFDSHLRVIFSNCGGM